MALTRLELLARLARMKIETTTVDHPPLHSVEESRRLRGAIAGAHTKNLFLKCKKERLWLVVAPEDAAIDLKDLHRRLGSGRLSFGNADLLRATLGVEPGSVTPFALVNDAARQVTPVFDAALMGHAVINCHPLENTATTTIARDDLLAFVRSCGHEPLILDISGPERSQAGVAAS